MTPILIGYDPREDASYRVCEHSVRRRASVPVVTYAIKRKTMEMAGLYWRRSEMRNGQRIDCQDGRPFSTDFSFTRFLVPRICSDRTGWALFCDGDFLWRADVAELLALADERYAVMVVRHDHKPMETTKMDGQKQEPYPRKNWSSLVLWNLDHPANKALTVEEVNTRPGSWLHGFGWLEDEEIGGLPEAWNWLDGHSSPAMEPKAVHFTRGTPELGWETQYAGEWRRELALLQKPKVSEWVRACA